MAKMRETDIEAAVNQMHLDAFLKTIERRCIGYIESYLMLQWAGRKNERREFWEIVAKRWDAVTAKDGYDSQCDCLYIGRPEGPNWMSFVWFGSVGFEGSGEDDWVSLSKLAGRDESPDDDA